MSPAETQTPEEYFADLSTGKTAATDKEVDRGVTQFFRHMTISIFAWILAQMEEDEATKYVAHLVKAWIKQSRTTRAARLKLHTDMMQTPLGKAMAVTGKPDGEAMLVWLETSLQSAKDEIMPCLANALESAKEIREMFL